MEQLNILLLRTRIGESVALIAAGAPILDYVTEIINPILATLSAILGVIAGVYTIKLKHAELRRRHAAMRTTPESGEAGKSVQDG